MSEPRPVENISNSTAGLAPSPKRRNDGSLKVVGERFQPVLTLQTFDGGFADSLQARM